MAAQEIDLATKLFTAVQPQKIVYFFSTPIFSVLLRSAAIIYSVLVRDYLFIYYFQLPFQTATLIAAKRTQWRTFQLRNACL
jgi:hypothetical protein